MLQIKTIRNTDPAAFDDAVNAALAEGWILTRRLAGPDFIAEMERVIITEAERCCETCAHRSKPGYDTPCCDCVHSIHAMDGWQKEVIL